MVENYGEEVLKVEAIWLHVDYLILDSYVEENYWLITMSAHSFSRIHIDPRPWLVHSIDILILMPLLSLANPYDPFQKVLGQLRT